MKKLIVNKKYDRKKLNKFLLENISNLSNNLFYKTLRKKDIKINGKRVSENVIIHENDEILVYISDTILESNQELDIFFEDDNILIINKPYNDSNLGIKYRYSSCKFWIVFIMQNVSLIQNIQFIYQDWIFMIMGLDGFHFKTSNNTHTTLPHINLYLPFKNKIIFTNNLITQ